MNREREKGAGAGPAGDPGGVDTRFSRRRLLSGLVATVAAPRLAVAQPAQPAPTPTLPTQPPQPPPSLRAAPPAAAAPAATFDQEIIVDIHCHSFNATDLPVSGFAAHYVPYLSDFAQEVWALPEKVFRKIAAVAERLIGHPAPSPEAEAASLAQALRDRRGVSAIAPFPIPGGALGAVATEIAALLHRNAAEVETAIDQIVQLLWVVSHGRAEVAATLIDTYSTVNLFTPCLVDYDAWSGEAAPTGLPQQIQLHEMVSRLAMHDLLGAKGVRLHSFAPFDPLREVKRKKPLSEPYRPYGASVAPFKDAAPYPYPCAPPALALAAPLTGAIPALADDAGAIELVRHAIEQCGFLGVKMYPPVGFLPIGNAEWRGDETGKALDRALRAFYAYCQAEEVPITVHTSVANGYALGYGGLARPDNWGGVLAVFPHLRINFGHFGHDEGTDNVAGIEACQAWIRQASLLIQDYPNVYADMSNSPLVYDPAYARKLLTWIDRLGKRYPKLGKRLMYGSDWWLNQLGPKFEQFVSEFQVQLAGRFDPVGVGDLMGRNALRFLGFIDDAGAFVANSRNRARLKRYYQRAGVGSPAWLG